MSTSTPTNARGEFYRLMGRLLRNAVPYMPMMVASVLFMVVYAVVSTGATVLGKVLIDYVLPEDSIPAAWALLGVDRAELLVWLTVAGLGLAVLIGLTGFLNAYLRSWVMGRIMVDLQNDLCRHLLSLPLRFYHKHKVGDLMSRVTNDIGTTGMALSIIFGDLILQPIYMIAAVGFCLFYSWQLSLVVFLGFPIVIFPIIYFGKKIRRGSHKRLLVVSELVSAMQQMFSGIRIVKAFRSEDREYRRFQGVNHTAFQRGMKVAKASLAGRSMVEFLTHFSVPLVLLAGGTLVIRGMWGLTSGDLFGFLWSMSMIYKPLRTLSKEYNQVQESLAGAARIFELLDTRPQTEDRQGSVSLDRVKSSVAFRDVRFAYDQETVLKGVSFEVRAGEMVALVGPSGAGKSTTLDLLARFYDPADGRVELDGVDLRDYTRDSLMEQVSMVTQEPFLFNTTVAENIRYGRPSATDEEVFAAARAAHIHEVIENLPEGYQTVVGERGSVLSGGERQRVTIARALLKGGSLLLLDEATSSLDTESERAVQAALENLMKGRTTFVIAHRLSTVLHADRILVVESGRIVEQGRHAELLAAGGLYAYLYRLQFDAPLQRAEDAARGARK